MALAVSSVAVWCQGDGDAGSLAAIEARRELVVVAAELDAGDVAQAHGRAVGVGAQDDRAELLRRTHLSLDDDGEVHGVMRRARLGADRAGSDLRILLQNGIGHVGGVERQAAQLVGIDPDAQCALGRVERSATDAGDAPDLVDDIADEEIAEADLVDRAVGRNEGDDLQCRRRGFLDEHALLTHFGRQACLDALQAVLYLDGGVAGIGAGLEVGDDLDDAERVRRRFIAEDVGRTVELILDEPRRSRIEILDGRSGKLRRQGDRRRRDDWVLRNGKARDGENASQADEERNDPGEDGPVNEEASHGGVSGCVGSVYACLLDGGRGGPKDARLLLDALMIDRRHDHAG